MLAGMPARDPTSAALPMAGERPERRDAADNRQRILRAATELLAAHGSAGLTMDAVAAAAGVGKGTVFRRFGDRSGLVQALLHDHMRAFQEAFLRGPPPLGPGAPAADRLEAFVVALVQLQVRHLDLALANEATPGADEAPIGASLLLHVRTLVAEIAPAVDARVLAAYVLGAVTPSTIVRIHAVDGVGEAELEAAARALLRGLVPAPAAGDQSASLKPSCVASKPSAP
jgi:AcrR family transcriptional regulator